MKILVTDDSIVFRSQISASLSGVEGIEIVGTAANGKIAIGKLQQFDIDLITLDMEMPEMNGLETIKEMKRLGFRTKIIVFSSQTIRGAEAALEALAAGADDVVAKPSSDEMNFEKAQKMIEEALVPRVLQFLKANIRSGQPTPRPAPVRPVAAIPSTVASAKKNLTYFLPKAVVIASSTGGPSALELLFSQLKVTPKLPILIVQHMPPVFTQILARRLGEISGIPVHEAVHNQAVLPGNVYLAPGGYHMQMANESGKLLIKLNQDELRNSVRPAADFLFETAGAIYKDQLLGIVLTGMGEDGAAGARYIHNLGGGIIIQDKESCVVFGMPGAVFVNDTYDDIMKINEMSDYLKTVIL